MTDSSDYAKTDEFKQAVRDALPANLLNLNFTTEPLFRARVEAIIGEALQPIQGLRERDAQTTAGAINDLRTQIAELQRLAHDELGTKLRALDQAVQTLQRGNGGKAA